MINNCQNLEIIFQIMSIVIDPSAQEDIYMCIRHTFYGHQAILKSKTEMSWLVSSNPQD